MTQGLFGSSARVLDRWFWGVLFGLPYKNIIPRRTVQYTYTPDEFVRQELQDRPMKALPTLCPCSSGALGPTRSLSLPVQARSSKQDHLQTCANDATATPTASGLGSSRDGEATFRTAALFCLRQVRGAWQHQMVYGKLG